MTEFRKNFLKQINNDLTWLKGVLCNDIPNKEKRNYIEVLINNLKEEINNYLRRNE